MARLLSLLALAHASIAVSSVTYYWNGAPTWYAQSGPFLQLDNDVNFYYQGDGNIVIYKGSPVEPNALWNSGTPGHNCGAYGSCTLVFQGDGNFVASDSNGPYFSTGTNSYSGHQDSALTMVMQNSPPYITLYDGQGDWEWFTSGSSGHKSQNPDGPGPIEPGPPAGGQEPPCTQASCPNSPKKAKRFSA